MYHNRLSDFIHDGFAADPVTFKETFEVRNELETAVVYRIRPKWNFKELHTDWSRLGGDDKDWKGVSWLEIKTEVISLCMGRGGQVNRSLSPRSTYLGPKPCDPGSLWLSSP